MQISINNLQHKLALNLDQIKTIVKKILKKEKVKKAEMSFAFVTSQRIRALNKKFMKRAYVTDVIAFDLRENLKEDELFGDIIISTDAVIQNSKRFRASKEQELVLYIIHGILHLLGYDDHSEKDIKEMRVKEKKLLEYLGDKVNNIINDKDE